MKIKFNSSKNFVSVCPILYIITKHLQNYVYIKQDKKNSKIGFTAKTKPLPNTVKSKNHGLDIPFYRNSNFLTIIITLIIIIRNLGHYL